MQRRQVDLAHGEPAGLDEARAAPQREIRLLDLAAERAALDQPHDEVDKLAAAPEIDHGQDVRMLQVGDDARLALCARVNASFCGRSAMGVAGEILFGLGQWSPPEAQAVIDSSGFDYGRSQSGLITDMDTLLTRI